jgi:hypothetical protein
LLTLLLARLLRPQDVPHGHFTPQVLATPSFASSWDEIDSQWFIQGGKVEFLRSQVQFLERSENRCWKLLKTMGAAYLKLRQCGNVNEFDSLWRYKWYGSRTFEDRIPNSPDRSDHICFLFRRAEKIHTEIESNRLLLYQSQETLDAMAKDAERRRRENMRERADALAKVGRDERQNKQRY